MSSIWECIHRQSGARFCVKVYDRRMLSHHEEIVLVKEADIFLYVQEHFYQKRSIYHQPRSFSDSGLLKLIDLIVESNHLYLIMEYITGGNLLSRIVQDYSSGWEEHKVREIALGILRGVQNLHSMGILHGDLEPQNILIDSDDSRVAIIDFGCATRVTQHIDCPSNHIKDHRFDNSINKNDEMHRSSIIQFANFAYIAPEILQGFKYNTQSDMWSLGVTLYFCLYGFCPFTTQKVKEEINTNKTFVNGMGAIANYSTSNDSRFGRRLNRSLQRICKADYIFPKEHWNHISRQAKQFISALLHVDPSVRMTAKEALQHKWFQKKSCSSSQHLQIAGVFPSSANGHLSSPMQRSIIHRACTSIFPKKQSGASTPNRRPDVLFTSRCDRSSNFAEHNYEKDNDEQSISISTFCSSKSSAYSTEYNYYHHHRTQIP